MTILINNAVLANTIFYAILIAVLLISIRSRRDKDVLPVTASQELKGFAILTVVFAHVAYALVSDNRFLSPISTMAGVGVNLFLLLSGYGLAMSALKKPLSIWQFYKNRLSKLYFPFWLILIVLFVLDFVFLKINYSWSYIIQSFFGLFTHADLYADINSPFWYFTLIVFYYLIFPLLFIKKAPWLSALLIYGLSYLILNLHPALLMNVQHLYVVHILAFPVGLFLGSLFYQEKISTRVSLFLQKIWSQKYPIIYGALVSLAAAIFIYSSIHSGVGDKPYIEELISLVSCLALLVLFVLKRFEIKALYWLGFFSYEIYLFHWPIMYRYDFLFKFLPAWLAVILYLFVFIGLAWLMQKLIAQIGKKKS